MFRMLSFRSNRFAMLALIACFVLAGFSPVHAGSSYFFRVTFGTPTCSPTTGYSMSIPQSADVNYPGGASIVVTAVENGASSSTTVPLPTGASGQQTFGNLFVFGTVPASMVWTVDLYVDGNQQSHSVSTASCTAANVGSATNSFNDLNNTGPAVPAGFVLKTITCTTPVYSTPGGAPVGENKVLMGQTWYVNPTPVKDSAGNWWTELFASGYNNPYIPTSCVR